MRPERARQDFTQGGRKNRSVDNPPLSCHRNNVQTSRFSSFAIPGLSLLLALLAFGPVRHALADPVSDLAAFSAFENIDPAKLAGAKPLGGRGAPISFPRGLAVQSCYVLPLPLREAVAFQKEWKATRHPELKVYLHRDLSLKAAPSEFQTISSAPDNSAVRALVAATQALNPERPELQLSAGEAKLFNKAAADGASGAMPPAVAAFWSRVLQQRTAAFVAGGASKQPAYANEGEPVRSSEEIVQLLKEQPKIAHQFKTLLDESGWQNGGGKLTPSLSMELFDVEGLGAFSLGAAYAKSTGESAQTLDVQFYSSGGYFALITLHQFWPVKIGSKEATLVWRGDLLSSASLAELHGVERLGSSGAMMKAIQKNIGFLQKDAAEKR